MSDFVAEKVQRANARALDIEVFRPTIQANRAAVILVHGGGWGRGHRSMMHGYAKELAMRGFVAVAAEYRLLPEAPWPAQLNDVRDVVRWTKANAESLGIDTTKIALQGYSAGAHLALLVGGTQPGSGNEDKLGASAEGTEVGAIVSFFAPARLDANPAALAHPPYSLLLDGGGVEAARLVSPIYYVGRNFPSTFILGGFSDYMQPISAGLDLLKAFIDAGAEVEFHYLHSQVHEFPSTPGMMSGIMAEVAFFYRRTMLDREALAAEAREHNLFARASSRQEFFALAAAS